MSSMFEKNVFYGYIIKGDLNGAIRYVKQFPEQTERYNRYASVFYHEQYIAYEVDPSLNEILTIYQRYYRDAFYLCIGQKKAADRLRESLADFLGISDDGIELSDIEQTQIAAAFSAKGYHFLGGRSSGYYGPYIWQTTEAREYEVELPDGVQAYTVNLLDGFISKSWIDYLSFGEIGPGGWTDGDGIINCVKSSYDFDSENFNVSLLKHEAQHAMDLLTYKDMSSEDLEYRAKLVELIYSGERNLLEQFVREADGSDRSNGHSAASDRIVDGFSEKLGVNRERLTALSIEKVQTVAKALFAESSKEIKWKYA